VLEDDAKVLVTTPSANKFYRMEEDRAIVTNICDVGDNCALEYLPEHNIPFAGSKTLQKNIFRLRSTSVLIAGDMTTPGRVARKECFQYEYFHSLTKIYVDGKITAYDFMKMEPGKKDMKGIGLLEGKNVVASFYLFKKDYSAEIRNQLSLKIKTTTEFAGGSPP
jgi:urease accessory protein